MKSILRSNDYEVESVRSGPYPLLRDCTVRGTAIALEASSPEAIASEVIHTARASVARVAADSIPHAIEITFDEAGSCRTADYTLSFRQVRRAVAA